MDEVLQEEAMMSSNEMNFEEHIPTQAVVSIVPEDYETLPETAERNEIASGKNILSGDGLELHLNRPLPKPISHVHLKFVDTDDTTTLNVVTNI